MSIKNNALILSVVLLLVFMTGAVSAVNQTDAVTNHETDFRANDTCDDVLEMSDDTVTGEDLPQKTTIKSNDTNIVSGTDFSARLCDENGRGIANKTVQFTLNNKSANHTTDADGVAKLKVSLNPGTYTVKYSFNGDGYAACENATDIFVIPTSDSKIKASDYTAYVGVTNTYKVTLTVANTPLANRLVTFKLNGKTYSRKTNAKGEAAINIREPQGTYKIEYSYAGEDNIKSVSGTSKITVKKGMPVKITKYSARVYRHKKADYFKIKLTDTRGSVLKSKRVTFTLNGKKYVKKTNANGIASLKVKLKIGSYKIGVGFAKTAVYGKASKTFTVKVKTNKKLHNGMWLFGKDMYSTDLAKLEKYGINEVFLNFKALELHGKTNVEKWIKQAKTHGIRVHLWMQVFYGANNWQNPVTSGGSIKYDLINSKVREAVKYAKVKGVSGVHFDYVRYPGNAHNYKNSVKAINHFIKKATAGVHKVNKKLVVSAAVMPEPSGMKYYYGQDIATMGKYLDAIIPMVYKGNYHAGTKWIKSVTGTFAKQSKRAQIWTGLQSYRSDASLKKIPAKELMGDAEVSIAGGAYGVILFRFGLFNYINFNNL